MNLAWSLLLGGTLALSTTTIFAKSTTTASLAIGGRPIAGKIVNVHIVISGRHLAYNGGGSAFGGNVQVFVQGTKVASIQSTSLNTSNVSCGYDAGSRIKICQGEPTTIDYPVRLPTAVGSSLVVSARYTGDNESHASNSAAATIKIVGQSSSSAFDLLLKD